MNPGDRRLRLRKTTLRSLHEELASNIRGGGSLIICPKLETGGDTAQTCTCTCTCLSCNLTCGDATCNCPSYGC